MPDITIVCERCGSDRFLATTAIPSAETVQSIECALCGHGIRVDEVIVFREITYISGTYDAVPERTNRMNNFDQ